MFVVWMTPGKSMAKFSGLGEHEGVLGCGFTDDTTTAAAGRRLANGSRRIDGGSGIQGWARSRSIIPTVSRVVSRRGHPIDPRLNDAPQGGLSVSNPGAEREIEEEQGAFSEQKHVEIQNSDEPILGTRG